MMIWRILLIPAFIVWVIFAFIPLIIILIIGFFLWIKTGESFHFMDRCVTALAKPLDPFYRNAGLLSRMVPIIGKAAIVCLWLSQPGKQRESGE